jgi:nitroreductase/NAD-dependent dihydropyrimidine dehydrogenase PreA subunit
MLAIAVDMDVCRRCGTCTLACPRGVFAQEEKGTVPKITSLEMCFGCGQCVAVCPQGAVSHSGYPEGAVTPIVFDQIPTYDQVLELIRSRRSKRVFRDKAVGRSTIEQVLEAARFAPSEHNVQGTEFVVIQDKGIIDEIATLAARYYEGLARRLRNPVGRLAFRVMLGQRSFDAVLEMLPEMEGVVSLFDRGVDYILRAPPVLILFCADTAGGFPSVNANVSLMNAMLAAESLGLGCYYAGFVLRACRRSDTIAKLVSLPETHGIYGVLAMGHPRVKFRKWPERKAAKVTWIGTG